MDKQKRWQFYVIVAVLLLTIYNILPTVFFYTKPLGSPIDEGRAHTVAMQVVDRLDEMEGDTKEWLNSFSHLIGVKPLSIKLVPNNSQLIEVTLSSEKDAELFKRFLPRAGALIPFVPAQLALNSGVADNSSTVVVQRNIGVHIDPSEVAKLFKYTPKYDANGEISDFYRDLVFDRVSQIATVLGGASHSAVRIESIVNQPNGSRTDESVVTLAREIVDHELLFRKSNAIAKRYEASFSQINAKKGDAFLDKFIAKIESLDKKMKDQLIVLLKEQSALKEKGEALDSVRLEQLTLLNGQTLSLESASAILKKNLAEFQKGQKPLTTEKVKELLTKGYSPQESTQVVDLTGYHPFIKSLLINWQSGEVSLLLYDDVQHLRSVEGKTEKEVFVRDRLNQYIINDVARLSRLTDENFKPSDSGYSVELDQLSNSQSYLTIDLGYLAQKRADQVLGQVALYWTPTHADLVRDAYPIHSYDEFKKLSPEDRRLGLVVYAPAMYAESPPEGFRSNSIYVIAKGLDAVINKYKESPDSPESKAFVDDFNQLYQTLQKMGFIGYPATAFNLPKEFSQDYIFELNDYYTTLLKATRENFTVKGNKRYAVLDFSDVEQRILTWNRIEDKIQEDLLKWRDAYQASQVDLNISNHYTVPAPTKNVYWTNFKLSFLKYFRGDDRKTLKWGLDLSGGKTVRIGLVDQNGRPVTDPEDLKQAVNELYNRINSMGVSERTIRIENSNILLDFPGSQNLSASELIKASAMYFHIVNEKFSPNNAALASVSNQFLQEVWNEAVVTNRKDSESLNEIAWQHLGGDSTLSELSYPRSEAAKILYENGLRLANPRERVMSSQFNDVLSSVAVFRANDSADWDEQTNPLLFIFHNYGLEGSNLEGVQAGYDPSEGNILTFNVKSGARDDFAAWTTQFAEDKITGTLKETYSKGKGWRMAVILNGTIITAPSLNGALRESARISGRFSQREINQLVTDLKAGSLSFTPRILSEENVSPELGREERFKGIAASLIALILVVLAMVGYYKFAGLVASCAVLLNIFIMWGVLQNLDAAITLPGIAGIVLTIGMAVDANVLVFERVREEFKLSGRIGSAIHTGYRKAFSAIVDSNITTIIAAFILIQFDSGPIKGFAITLIIGILSSMFTALFLTRYFFAGWVKNPQNKKLEMAQFLKDTHFDFLGQSRKAIIISLIVMAIGTFFLFTERKTIFGMDFTGGYSLNIELAEQATSPNYRLAAKEALMNKGVYRSDFEVRELSRPNFLRIQFGTSMNEEGHPFYKMVETNSEGQYAYDYQKDPRLNWVVTTLQEANLPIEASQLTTIQNNWTSMSGQFSDAMRNNAILALAAALFAILVYITVRFEFKFAIGAVIGLAHDVFITLGILALFHALGFSVQIDLQVVGAIMTIIGYSLNDTIIVFDRIREDIKIMRKTSFHDIINHALNVTLSRTIMTSGTTLLVLLALVLFGGQSIFSFSLVMTVGVVVGTLSSLFIASPVMLYFHNREIANKADAQTQR
jgi:SecD/SecF fusion protein